MFLHVHKDTLHDPSLMKGIHTLILFGGTIVIVKICETMITIDNDNIIVNCKQKYVGVAPRCS
jgi:hypothetical protein